MGLAIRFNVFSEVADLHSFLLPNLQSESLQSNGARRRLIVVTLRIIKYTSLEIRWNLLALLPSTNENSLTWARPAATIYFVFRVSRKNKRRTNTETTNLMKTTPRVSVNTRGNSFSTNVGKTWRPVRIGQTILDNNYSYTLQWT